MERTSHPATASDAQRWPYAAVPALSLLMVLPLLLHGPSCGHDFGFHMQSWMDAAAQMRHGTLYPQWAVSPAFNAGEPRFVFYPPLSWFLGSLLLLVLPSAVVPAAFTWLALTLAGWGMLALARPFAPPGASLLVAAAYLGNPYLLFTAFERTAYAELLAAAWIPWLVRAALARRPAVLPLAVPLALLWLTNAPAAVMGTYALVLLILLRVALRFFQRPEGLRIGPWVRSQLPLLGAGAGGLVLGLALAGVYLVPAAWERRYVQIAMAIIPNMRVEDNFLFGHTGYGPHDRVLRTASLTAVLVIALTAAVFAVALWRNRKEAPGSRRRELVAALGLLALLLSLLQLHFTLPIWHFAPELAFLQFPWRWLAMLGCLFATALALLLSRWQAPALVALPAALLLAGGAAALGIVPFREGCDAVGLPGARVARFAAHHGVGPTDEYTPGDADNDQLRWDDPAWWLSPDPNAPGPGTVPNPAATIEDYDEPPPLNQTIAGIPPHHLQLQLSRPEDLILNLRDFPAWQVRVNGQLPPHVERDDGLIALALPAGSDTVDIRWRRMPDVWLGDALSACALCVAGGLGFRSRRIGFKQ